MAVLDVYQTLHASPMTNRLINNTQIAVFGLWLLVCGWLTPAAAVEISDLYRVDVEVNDQSIAQRKQGIRVGFQELIVRVTGTDQALSDTQIRAAARNPDRYIQQFNYHSDTIADETRQYLQIDFDSGLINKLVRKAGLTLWDKSRPTLLVWLAHDEAGERSLLGSGDGSEVHELNRQLQQTARRRGLPLVQPLLDFEDQLALPVAAMWGLFEDKIASASARYNTEAVLAGRVFQVAEQEWQGRWLLLFNGKVQSFAYRGESQQSFVDFGMAQAAEQLASFYAINTAQGAGNQWRVKVEGINNLADYATVTAYLTQFSLVKSLFVEAIDGSQLTVQISTEGTLEQLQSALALDNKLQRLADGSNAGGLSTGFETRYQWQP